MVDPTTTWVGTRQKLMSGLAEKHNNISKSTDKVATDWNGRRHQVKTLYKRMKKVELAHRVTC